MQAYINVSDELSKNSSIDTRHSGSTCVSVLIVANKVFCANVGNSKAILVRTFDPPINEILTIPKQNETKIKFFFPFFLIFFAPK